MDKLNKMITIGIFLFSVLIASSNAVLYTFPADFKFGAASAAYQVEGAWNVDGKSPSIWDNLTHSNPESIRDRSNGDVASNSYEFYKKDVEALKNAGLQFYRFSIAWARIIPDGTTVNEKGIEYYSNLIDELIANDIEPVVTMYHWDLPQYLQDLGGWPNPLMVKYFTEYADVLFGRFGNRVSRWITFNEPFVFCWEGYGGGSKAPMIKARGIGEYLCGHTMLQSHAAAYHLYKDKYFNQQLGQIGISLDTAHYYPGEGVDQSFADKAITFKLGWFANAIFSEEGGYPQVMVDEISRRSDNEGRPWSRLPSMSEDMKNSLRGAADFLGLNYYSSNYVAPTAQEPVTISWYDDLNLDFSSDPNWPRAKSGWLYSVPEGLRDLLNWIRNEYNNPPLLITENGWSDDGQLNDDGRVEYLKAHLASVSQAIADGCNVVGHTSWSIVDNFEWMEGYTERFGIYYIDMNDPERNRVPKESVNLLKQVTTDRSVEY